MTCSLNAQTLQILYEYHLDIDLKEKLGSQAYMLDKYGVTETLHIVKDTFQLITNGKKSSFSILNDSENKIEIKTNGNTLRISTLENLTRTYTSHLDNMCSLALPINQKVEIISDLIPDICWTDSKETKLILGYKCNKVKGMHCGWEFNAWYTTDIPISSGPMYFGGLPGLILELEFIGGGNKTYQAINIVNNPKLEIKNSIEKGKAKKFNEICNEK